MFREGTVVSDHLQHSNGDLNIDRSLFSMNIYMYTVFDDELFSYMAFIGINRNKLPWLHQTKHVVVLFNDADNAMYFSLHYLLT